MQLTLRDDAALDDPNDDRLGYAPFAEAVAASISSVSKPKGFVFAVNGVWGSGKTTAVNFIIHELNKRTDAPDVIQFNPWWFSGQEDLTKIFFDEVTGTIGRTISDDAENAVRAFSRRLAGFRSGAKVALNLVPFVKDLPEGIHDAFLDAVGVGAEELSNEKSITQLKQDVSEALQASSKKTLVVIDDIDRLTADEQLQIFKLVKSVADLPNIIYLLVFDDKLSNRALDQRPEFKDGAYLEKIVQVPFSLPMPSQARLDDFFFSQLNELIKNTSPADDYGWFRTWNEIVKPNLTTPRRVNQLINGIRSAWAYIGSDVDLTDFIAIEALRIFRKDLYSIILERNNWLTQRPVMSSGKMEDKIASDVLSVLPDSQKAYAEKTLEIMFPRYATARSTFSGMSSRKGEKRICDPAHFRTYFQFGVDLDTYAECDWKDCLAELEKVGNLAAHFLKLVNSIRSDGRSKANSMLEEFQSRTPNLSESDAEKLCRALLVDGDILQSAAENPNDTMRPGIDYVLAWTIVGLLKRVPSKRRDSLVVEAFRESNGLAVTGFILFLLGRPFGKFLEQGDHSNIDDALISEDALSALQEIWLCSLEAFVADDRIWTTPNHRISLFYRWRTLRGDDFFADWMSKMWAEPSRRTQVADLLTYTSWSSAVGNFPDVPRHIVGPFIDLDIVEAEMRLVADSENSSADDVRIAKRFLDGMNPGRNGIPS
tara:strand:- start:3920 stop:6052 length:2133 start_codon:yes stop_codon:yes gene_type:complete